jgi:hypothetical protein
MEEVVAVGGGFTQRVTGAEQVTDRVIAIASALIQGLEELSQPVAGIKLRRSGAP